MLLENNNAVLFSDLMQTHLNESGNILHNLGAVWELRKGNTAVVNRESLVTLYNDFH